MCMHIKDFGLNRIMVNIKVLKYTSKYRPNIIDSKHFIDLFINVIWDFR